MESPPCVSSKVLRAACFFSPRWQPPPHSPLPLRRQCCGARIRPQLPSQFGWAHLSLIRRRTRNSWQWPTANSACAAYCPAVELTDTQRITEIHRAFAKHDVVIAEVGRWKNLLEASPAQRQQNMRYVIDGLALADEVGALCCVDIAGSYSPEAWYGPHPENLSDEFFEAAVENARTIIDAVKPKRAKFSYEMMGWALPDSASSYLRMIKAIDRPAFAVHLDPCNLINSPARFYHNTDLLNECFDQLGQWIVSCHAKDVAWNVNPQMQFEEVVLGTGTLDYRTYLTRLASLSQDVPLMIEHMKDADQYDRSRQHVFAVGKEAGVVFE